ncbi:MAG TPA: ATP-binding protein [Gemmatimonadales bacterium]|nr:ATP-binding protein [Gemmatimonadales bacterium]
MSGPSLQLVRAADQAKDVRAFWQAAVEALREWLGARWAAIEYRGLNEQGTVTAGTEAGITVPEALTWGDADGRRVELRFAGARPGWDREREGGGPVGGAALEIAARLAIMVGRRVGLERERRLGTFLVELSRWLMAAPDTDLLLRYTLQSVMALVDANGAYVALRQGGGDALRVATALGEAAPLKGMELSLHASTTGRVVRSGEALVTEHLAAERDSSGIARGLTPEGRAGMIAPLHTAGGVIGAAGVVRYPTPDRPNPPAFGLTDLHYFTAVAAHIAGGIELSQAVASTRVAADRARAMVNASPLPMALTDAGGRVQQVNEAACRVFGVSGEEEALGRSLEALGLSPSGITLRLVLAGRGEGEPWHGRVLVTQPSGERRICDCTITGLAGLGSDALLVALYDRTDELRAQRELIAREKLATVGEIAGGVAHEVNNPLTAIRMEAELLSRASRDPETAEAAGTIIREVDRAARIVRSLLRLARRADTTPTRVHLNELVRDVAEIRQRVLRTEGVEIRTVLDQAAPAVLGLGQELQQVVINLVTNAEHAVRRHTPAVIRLTTTAHGGWVRLAVEDSGPGVPREIRDRIFDPFFTTKGPDEGSGLGLAICQRVVSEVGGRIWLEDSEELGGAKFMVELPAAPEEAVTTIG